MPRGIPTKPATSRATPLSFRCVASTPRKSFLGSRAKARACWRVSILSLLYRCHCHSPAAGAGYAYSALDEAEEEIGSYSHEANEDDPGVELGRVVDALLEEE